jgi:L-iditol 2-dehydrogenase
LKQTDGRGVDVAIVATSSLKALEDALEMVRKGGAVMMFGVPSKGATMDLDMSKIYSKEITLVTSYAASDKDTKEALRLIESGKIDVKQLVTHKYPILDSQKAFDHAKTGENAMKIIITK